MQDQQPPDMSKDRLGPLKALFSADFRNLLEDQKKVNQIEANFIKAEDIYHAHRIYNEFPIEEIKSVEDSTLTMQQKRVGKGNWELESIYTDKKTGRSIVYIYRLLPKIPRSDDSLVKLRERKPSARDRVEYPSFELDGNGHQGRLSIDYRVGDRLDFTLRVQNQFLAHLTQKYPPVTDKPK